MVLKSERTNKHGSVLTSLISPSIDPKIYAAGGKNCIHIIQYIYIYPLYAYFVTAEFWWVCCARMTHTSRSFPTFSHCSLTYWEFNIQFRIINICLEQIRCLSLRAADSTFVHWFAFLFSLMQCSRTSRRSCSKIFAHRSQTIRNNGASRTHVMDAS